VSENKGVRIVPFAGFKARTREDRKVNGAWPGLARAQGHVILDLGGVGSLDRVGLGTLLRFSTHVRAGGGKVSLSSLSEAVRLQALKMRLHRILDIFNTPAEALRTHPE
jgi:anti-anti-sigma regulatory factor